MKKTIYIFLAVALVTTILFSHKIIVGGYDKQNLFIIKFKEIMPTELKNKLRSTVYSLRAKLNEDKDKKIDQAKFKQGLNGNLIKSKLIKSETGAKKFIVRAFFLPFKRLDLNYGWRAIKNSKRAHYLEIINDKTLVVSGEGEFIYFETKNFNSNKLNQKAISTNIDALVSSNNLELIGIRDLLIDDENIYISVILKDKNENYTLSILSSTFDINKLDFEFFFDTELNLNNFSITTGGRIVKFEDNQLLFSIGYHGALDKVQNLNHLAGKIISINKLNKNYKILSLGHRNPQGLFYYQDKKGNKFILNSEHGPKGGDEINVNNLENNKLFNFGWPIASYGINYDGTNPFKPSHNEYGFDEPLKYFTPSIGISEISIIDDNKDFNTILVSSLRANSIYLLKIDKKFTKVFNTDRLDLDYRIRDLKYVESLDGHIMIFENTPSIGFIKNKI